MWISLVRQWGGEDGGHTSNPGLLARPQSSVTVTPMVIPQGRGGGGAGDSGPRRGLRA